MAFPGDVAQSALPVFREAAFRVERFDGVRALRATGPLEAGACAALNARLRRGPLPNSSQPPTPAATSSRNKNARTARIRITTVVMEVRGSGGYAARRFAVQCYVPSLERKRAA